MGKSDPLEIDTSLDKTRFSIDELTTDLSAFLHFLLKQSGDNSSQTSYWALIPDSLDVKWDETIEDFYLKKSLHNRKIYIYAKAPATENLKIIKKVELLCNFQSIVAENQINTVTLLMSKLRYSDREKLKNDYLHYKDGLTKTKKTHSE